MALRIEFVSVPVERRQHNGKYIILLGDCGWGPVQKDNDLFSKLGAVPGTHGHAGTIRQTGLTALSASWQIRVLTPSLLPSQMVKGRRIGFSCSKKID